MGNILICTCPGLNDKSANIDINVKPNDTNMNQKNNNVKNVENRTIANNSNNVNVNNNIDINNNNNINNNNINNMINNNINNRIYSNSDNIKNDNEVSNLSMHSFNKNKSISPSNNPLGGLVKIIPKNEQ